MTVKEILSQKNLPKMVQEGLKLMGIREVPGKESNPAILLMAKALGIDNIYTNDDTAWCALAVSYIWYKAGKPLLPLKGYDFLRASSFLRVGDDVAMLGLDPSFGDILVFKRLGGYHVGLYIAESEDTYYVMGGNQSNTFNITEISKGRCVSVRRPPYNSIPSTVTPYHIHATGDVSTNEL